MSRGEAGLLRPGDGVLGGLPLRGESGFKPSRGENLRTITPKKLRSRFAAPVGLGLDFGLGFFFILPKLGKLGARLPFVGLRDPFGFIILCNDSMKI